MMKRYWRYPARKRDAESEWIVFAIMVAVVLPFLLAVFSGHFSFGRALWPPLTPDNMLFIIVVVLVLVAVAVFASFMNWRQAKMNRDLRVYQQQVTRDRAACQERENELEREHDLLGLEPCLPVAIPEELFGVTGDGPTGQEGEQQPLVDPEQVFLEKLFGDNP